MKNKALFIGLGVVALGGLLFFMMRKKGTDTTASQDMETKSADATASQDMETKSAAATPSAVATPTEAPLPSKGIAITTTQPAAPTCGCGAGQIPCPNMRCATKALSGNKFGANMPKPQPSTSAPKADPETERFAFNLVF